MKYNLSKIMKDAWAIYRMAQKWVGKLSFAECLRRAWTAAKDDMAKESKINGGTIEAKINGIYVFIRRSPIAMSGRMGWYVEGKTYPIRQALKKAGFRWDVEARKWYTLDASIVKVFA